MDDRTAEAVRILPGDVRYGNGIGDRSVPLDLIGDIACSRSASP
jgi:hypothetical protein